jgi:hypothetical protein
MKSIPMFLCLLAIAVCSWAQPLPHPADPQILAIVEQISADSILANITHLTEFHTRHTFSDTTSDSIGIGAAMRWAQAKGVSYDPNQRFAWEWFPWSGNFNGNPVTRHVLIARATGGDAARYLIGGHLDSRTVSINDNTGLAPGADDNGSSCAALLEMLRLLPDSIAHNLELIWFTGEEQGLWGSAAYAQYLSQQGARVDGMIGMDMIGHIISSGGGIDSLSMRLYAQGDFNQGGSASVSRNLQRYLKWIGEAYADVDSFDMRIIAATDRPGRGGDHISFSQAGYAAVRAMETNEDVAFQHNPNDVPQNLSPAYARRVARCTYGALLTMLQAPPVPPSPFVSFTSYQAVIIIPDSVVLPVGGRFRVSVRHTSDAYFSEIREIGADRLLVLSDIQPGIGYAFSVSRSDSADHPSPFSQEVTGQLGASRPGVPLPSSIELSASPNPFNGEIIFVVELPQSAQIGLSIYDLEGRRAATLLDGIREAGTHRIAWTPRELSSGVYFARLRTAHAMRILKIAYIR